jgi:serine/threonine-protein kinase HipA
MQTGKLDIYVFAHWKPMKETELIGVLSALNAKGKKAFSFAYAKNWIKSKN